MGGWERFMTSYLLLLDYSRVKRNKVKNKNKNKIK